MRAAGRSSRAVVRRLDGALAEFEGGLGDRWKDTVIVVATEFGRTARINGTDGTDHGTGTIALLAGGAVSGGRVISDWPGLKAANLYENRDLKPTTDLRGVIKGVLRDHLGLGERCWRKQCFRTAARRKLRRGWWFSIARFFYPSPFVGESTGTSRSRWGCSTYAATHAMSSPRKRGSMLPQSSI